MMDIQEIEKVGEQIKKRENQSRLVIQIELKSLSLIKI
jgi:hypothetical protein